MKIHCFFEQSGTFKNEFIKLGYKAKDYDILNDFEETDKITDLFEQIEKGWLGIKSIFDEIEKEDLIIAFFPCTEFEDQKQLWMSGQNYGQRNWSQEQKLEYNLWLMGKLYKNYSILCKLCLIAKERNLKLIIENPYGKINFLGKYWSVKPKVIDTDRRKNGDYYQKPTQYFFINCEPQNNEIEEIAGTKESKPIENVHNKVERSMISSLYANRFIRRYINGM